MFIAKLTAVQILLLGWVLSRIAVFYPLLARLWALEIDQILMYLVCTRSDLALI